MVIIQRVKDLPARFSRADKVHVPQSAQLMGDGRFGHAKTFGKRADGQFAVHELGNDAQAIRIAEGAEQFGEFGGFWFGDLHN